MVTVCGTPCFLVWNTVFTPSRLKMYLVTESPCFEPSVSPVSLTVASGSSLRATISYQ